MSADVSQPATFNPEKLGASDKLFSATSLRVIRASNVRDRERLYKLSLSVENSKRSTNSEYEQLKKDMRRRQQQLQSKLMDKIKKPVMEPGIAEEPSLDDVFLPGVEGPAAGRRLGWGRLKTNMVPRMTMASLNQMARSSRSSSQTDCLEVPGDDGNVFIITGARRMSGRDGNIPPVPPPVGTTSVPGVSGEVSQSLPKPPTQRRGTRRSTVIDSEDLKRLVLRLHREDASVTDPTIMTEEERRIYEFIQKVMSSGAEPPAPTARRGFPGMRPRANTRIYSDDPLRRLSIALGVDLSSITERNPETPSDRRKRYLMQMNVNPITLPPIYTVRSKKLKSRETDWDITEPTKAPKPLTTVQWEEMKLCRYLRAPSQKYHAPFDAWAAEGE